MHGPRRLWSCFFPEHCKTSHFSFQQFLLVRNESSAISTTVHALTEALETAVIQPFFQKMGGHEIGGQVYKRSLTLLHRSERREAEPRVLGNPMRTGRDTGAGSLA